LETPTYVTELVGYLYRRLQGEIVSDFLVRVV